MSQGESAPDERLLANVWTVPNAVTFVRLLTVPWFWWLLARDDIGVAGVVVFVIGSTDWVDGYLARRLGQVSRLGAILDPVADRAMIASALIGGVVVGVVPAVIGIPLLVREAGVGIAAMVLASRGKKELEVRYQGKVATFVLYGAIPAFYLTGAGILASFFAPGAWIAGSAGLVLYWWVGTRYFLDIRGRLAS